MRSWHTFGTLASRGHVDHAGTHRTRFSKLHDYNQNDKRKVLAVKFKLNEKLSTLQKVNNEVLGLIEDEDAYENYQNKADVFETEIEEVITNVDSIILKPETKPVIRPFIPPICFFSSTTSKSQHKTSSS